MDLEGIELNVKDPRLWGTVLGILGGTALTKHLVPKATPLDYFVGGAGGGGLGYYAGQKYIEHQNAQEALAAKNKPAAATAVKEAPPSPPPPPDPRVVRQQALQKYIGYLRAHPELMGKDVTTEEIAAVKRLGLHQAKLSSGAKALIQVVPGMVERLNAAEDGRARLLALKARAAAIATMPKLKGRDALLNQNRRYQDMIGKHQMSQFSSWDWMNPLSDSGSNFSRDPGRMFVLDQPSGEDQRTDVGGTNHMIFDNEDSSLRNALWEFTQSPLTDISHNGGFALSTANEAPEYKSLSRKAPEWQ